ncbi:MAG: hypothetical protein J0M17_17670 [Planctomycetes bacterium]|nr:hypothetical protein [Planctomycetota bacterium]
MKASCFRIGAALVLLVAALQSAVVFAADDAVGKPLAPLSVELLQPSGAYEVVDVAATAQEKPIVYVLIPSSRWDRPVARFLKTLDDKLPDASATAEVRAVWLTGEIEATKEYLPKVVQSLQFQRTTLGAFNDDSGPEGWQPGGEAQALVVVARHGKAAARFVFGSINETDVPQVTDALTKALE